MSQFSPITGQTEALEDTRPMNPGKIVIFGQYKTGTTALFTRLQQSLPDNTRTLFEPLEYVPEAADSGRWVLAKTILKFPGHPQPVDYAGFLSFERQLYLTRDPRDWLVSATLFLTQEKAAIYRDDQALRWVMEYLRRKEHEPRAVPLIALLDYILRAPPALSLEQFGRRTQALHAWCIAFEARLRGEVFTLRYEDFVDGRLHALEHYLGFPLRGCGEVEERYDHVPRTKGYGNWTHWLTAEDVQFFRPFFDPYIRHYGYAPDWALSAAPLIRPEHSSQYVARVVQRKRTRLDPP